MTNVVFETAPECDVFVNSGHAPEHNNFYKNLINTSSYIALNSSDEKNWIPANDNEGPEEDPPAGGANTKTTRESMRTGIRWIDEIITILTGKALPNQKRSLYKFSNITIWCLSFLCLFLSISANLAALNWAHANANSMTDYVIVAFCYFWLTLVTVGRLRSQQVLYAHYAIHSAFSHNRWLNELVQTLALIIPLAANPQDYAQGHIKGHHKKKTFTTLQDPDAAFLYKLGFKPGMTKNALWKRFWITLVSPKFHATFLKNRFVSVFITSKPKFKLIAFSWSLILLTICWFMGPKASLFTVILPVTLFYQASSLVQFLTEHKWGITENGPSSDQDYADRCTGRFCGEKFPESRKNAAMTYAVRFIWLTKMVFIHVPTRIAILVGDMPVHDAHHLSGYLKNNPYRWHDAIFVREASIQAGDKYGMASRENWGLKGCINWVFDGYSSSKPL